MRGTNAHKQSNKGFNPHAFHQALRSITHIYFHFLVEPIIHDKAVSHPDSMRFHRMPCNVRIIPNIRVVEVCDLLLVRPIHKRRVDRGK